MVSHELGTGDIPKEPLVTIAKVTKPPEGDDETRDWWVLTFVEPFAKPLKVIATHQRALILMFGDDTDKWPGKRIGVRALVGTYFKKRQTAVRIVGSPDIKEPCSFSVKKWGGGKDTYSLIVMAAPNGKPSGPAPKTYPPTGTVNFGPKKGTKIPLLTRDELAAHITLGAEKLAAAGPNDSGWVPQTQANVDELKAEVANRVEADQATAELLPPAGDQPAPF